MAERELDHYQRWLQGNELCPRPDCSLPWCERRRSEGWSPADCDECELGNNAEGQSL
jgi:hypothetical protein